MKPLKKILAPTDLSEDSGTSLAYALPLAAESGAELVILRVTSRFQPWWSVDSDCDPLSGDSGLSGEPDPMHFSRKKH